MKYMLHLFLIFFPLPIYFMSISLFELGIDSTTIAPYAFFYYHNWIYVSHCIKISRNNPYKFLKIKSVTKYTLSKEIWINIIFYYNKSHTSLTYKSIPTSFDIICTVKLYNGQWPPALSPKCYLWMSKQAGKGRLNWHELKLIRFENWYHKKVKQKNEKLTSNLIKRLG
jgi:hypothetical protein